MARRQQVYTARVKRADDGAQDAKIKKKRDNNEKIGQLLKAYGVAQLSDLPAEKYEAFLADVSQI